MAKTVRSFKNVTEEIAAHRDIVGFLVHRRVDSCQGDLMPENPSRLTVAQVKDLIGQGLPVAFIDSRNPIAWGSSKVKLPGAHRVPIDEVERHLPALPRDRHLIVYCT